jgi:hypothetical protein
MNNWRTNLILIRLEQQQLDQLKEMSSGQPEPAGQLRHLILTALISGLPRSGSGIHTLFLRNITMSGHALTDYKKAGLLNKSAVLTIHVQSFLWR